MYECIRGDAKESVAELVLNCGVSILRHFGDMTDLKSIKGGKILDIQKAISASMRQIRIKLKILYGIDKEQGQRRVTSDSRFEINEEMQAKLKEIGEEEESKIDEDGNIISIKSKEDKGLKEEKKDKKSSNKKSKEKEKEGKKKEKDSDNEETIRELKKKLQQLEKGKEEEKEDKNKTKSEKSSETSGRNARKILSNF